MGPIKSHQTEPNHVVTFYQPNEMKETIALAYANTRDWLDPSAQPDRPEDARTSPDVAATAYFERSAELVGQAAGILGLHAKQQHYLSLAKKIRNAFSREYVAPSGRLVNEAQTAYALALEFGLLPEAQQQQHAAERLS